MNAAMYKEWKLEEKQRLTFIYKSAEQYDKQAGSRSLNAYSENGTNVKNQTSEHTPDTTQALTSLN